MPRFAKGGRRLREGSGHRGRAETEVMQPKDVGSHQNVEEARNGFSPRVSRGRLVLLTP